MAKEATGAGRALSRIIHTNVDSTPGEAEDPGMKDQAFKRRVGSRIQRARLALFDTQTEGAERLCVSPQELSRWERGTHIPSALWITVIARCFKTTPSCLLLGRRDR